VRPVLPSDAGTVALHRYPEEMDAAERGVYAAWVEGTVRRSAYLGFLAVTSAAGQEVVTAGAGLTLLEWGPSRGDPQPLRARVVNVWTHPEWRRRGLARTLVSACLDAAVARGVTRVSVGSSVMARGL